MEAQGRPWRFRQAIGSRTPRAARSRPHVKPAASRKSWARQIRAVGVRAGSGKRWPTGTRRATARSIYAAGPALAGFLAMAWQRSGMSVVLFALGCLLSPIIIIATLMLSRTTSSSVHTEAYSWLTTTTRRRPARGPAGRLTGSRAILLMAVWMGYYQSLSPCLCYITSFRSPS